VKAKPEALSAIADIAAEERLEEFSIACSGIGFPAFATESSKMPPSVLAATRTGLSGAPCVKAFPIKFETSWPMRIRSQLTGSVIANPFSIVRSIAPVRSSYTSTAPEDGSRLC
jgi:hypothetical protein